MKFIHQKHPGILNHLIGLDFFDGSQIERGGHTHWLYKLINNKLINKFMWFDYCMVCIHLIPNIIIGSTWYDGQHHNIQFAFFSICWGGSPYGKYCHFNLNGKLNKLI